MSTPSITQAFVFGAGLGTRLRPLTDDLPKPLIPIFQKPLITFALDHLIGIGIESFLINTHRLPELFARGFPENSYADRSIKLVMSQRCSRPAGASKTCKPISE